MPRLHLYSLLFAWLLVSAQMPLLAQTADTTTPEPASAPAQNITLTQISDQALSTGKLIQQMEQLAVQPLEIEELKERLSSNQKKLQTLRRESASLMDTSSVSVEQIQNSQNIWKYALEMLTKEQQIAKDRGLELEKGIALLVKEEDLWKQTQVKISEAPELVDGLQQSKQAITSITAARKNLGIPLQETLEISKQWQDLIDTSNDQLLTLKQNEDVIRKHLLSTLQPALWELNLDDFHVTSDYRRTLSLHWKLARYFLTQHPLKGAMILTAAVGMLLFLWYLRRNNNRLQEEHRGMSLRLPLFDRPLSTTLATSAALSLILYPNPPQLVNSFIAWLLFIPVVRLGMSRLPVIVRPFAWLVSIIFLINSLSLMIEAIPVLQRLWIVSCAAISFIVCIHALRRLASNEDHNTLAWKLLRTAVWLTMLTALAAAVAGIVGAATLAQFLVTGVANAAYAGFCMVVVAGIFSDLAVVAIYLPINTASQLINHNRPLLVGRLGKLITIVCLLGWIHFTLDQFMLADAMWAWISNTLNKELTIGNLAISLGDVSAVLITIWLSYKISQLLQFIFMEDIAPRTKMARGVPEAVSTLMHYCIVLIGFMMAISAAGIDMSKISIMIGALGVGIGIGMQDVVNNFTSGLILLFEQHIKQSDIVQCNTVNGKVTHIGLRSSVVRTFDGAEVILPNSQLVSVQVINWTHSDQHRRISIPIGVAYGSDPEMVIKTLVAAARAEEDILSDPPPAAFFLRFGASSMDFELKAWVTTGEILNETTSKLCVAINRQFDLAGISIPFPQQDIYVRGLPENFSRGETQEER